MKVKLITFHNKRYKYISSLCDVRFSSFCLKNDYDYENKFIVEDNPLFARLYKCKMILSVLSESKFDYVIYSDIDVAIKNCDYDIFKNYSFYKDITFSKDCHGLCSGFIVIKNTDFSKKFFETCLFLKSHEEENCKQTRSLFSWNGKYDLASIADQELIKSLYYGYKYIRNNLDIDLREDIVSNQNSNKDCILKSFAHHYWASGFDMKNLETKMSQDILKF